MELQDIEFIKIKRKSGKTDKVTRIAKIEKMYEDLRAFFSMKIALNLQKF